MYDCSQPERRKQFVLIITIWTTSFNKLTVIKGEIWVFVSRGVVITKDFKITEIISNIFLWVRPKVNTDCSPLEIPAAVVANCVAIAEQLRHQYDPTEVWSEFSFYFPKQTIWQPLHSDRSGAQKSESRSGLNFSLTLFFHSLLNGFRHSLSVQTSAALWMPLRRDWPNVCTNIPIFKRLSRLASLYDLASSYWDLQRHAKATEIRERGEGGSVKQPDEAVTAFKCGHSRQLQTL